MTDLRHRATASFEDRFGRSPAFAAKAPGRVNLIGEHTDYNDGFVLPMALPFATVIAGAPSGDHGSTLVDISSAGYGTASFQAGEIPEGLPGWARYVAGVGAILVDEGFALSGWVGAIDTEIPTGASLSSSAALEMAAILAFGAVGGFRVDPVHMAKIGQRVENEIMGIQSGIMDQFISANAVAGHASLIDCRSLTSEPAPVPATVVVIDTMSRRELVDSEYDLRRQSCERAAAEIGVSKLRDATLDQLGDVSDPIDRQRATHVINENARTLSAVVAMNDNDAVALGELMNQSHASLRDLYAVSGPELDRAVEIAQGTDGCYGARMTGGGFAGCCVALVANDAAQSFIDHVVVAYDRHTGITPVAWPCESSAGAELIEL